MASNVQKMKEALEKVNRHASAIMAITTVPELYAESINVVLHHAVEIGFVATETLEDEEEGGEE